MGEDLVLKTVTKSTLLGDIQYRGAISDFHPMKKLIEKYPEDELQLVWDEEEWYGQNFFLVHDLKCRDAVLADEEARARGGGEVSGTGRGGKSARDPTRTTDARGRDPDVDARRAFVVVTPRRRFVSPSSPRARSRA